MVTARLALYHVLIKLYFFYIFKFLVKYEHI